MDKTRISVVETAELLGVTPHFVRIGLQRGIFPWGYAVKTSSHWSYFINRQKLLKEELIREELINECND